MQWASLQTQKAFAKLLEQITTCATNLKPGNIGMLLLMNHCLFAFIEKKFENNFIIGVMLHKHFARISKAARATPAAILNYTLPNKKSRDLP